MSYVRIGDKVPDFRIASSTSEVFESDMFIGHKSMIFFFWTKCGDCRRAFPVIEQVWQELKDDPQVLIIPIARGQSGGEVREFMDAAGYTMPFYPDPSRAVFSLFAEQNVPRVYLIDSNGVVTWMAVTNLGVTAAELSGLIKSQN